MSRQRFERRQADSPDPAVVGRVAIRPGLAIVVGTMPVVVGLAAGFLADAGSLVATVSTIAAAIGTPLSEQTGSMWLFHAATLGLAGGCWLVGAGLVLDGLFD